MRAEQFSPEVLTGGAWVNFRGVMRWVPEPPPVVLTLVPEPKPAPDYLAMIACPRCSATVVQPCRTADGRPRHAHTHRIIPRRCICGEIPPPRKFYCRFCRAEKRAESRERYETKRRAS